MSMQAAVTRTHRPSYDIFILVITLLSLGIMLAMLLPFDEETHVVLGFYDNLICFIFLADFAYNLTGSHPRSEYFIRQRGWLDLIGSIPSFGFLRVTVILRLARLSRLARISRLLKGQGQKELISDVIHDRGRYALFLTVLMAILVLTISSVLVLQFEGRSPDSNITTGGDALWWALVTITTVGYGDFYPVTPAGRAVAAMLMAGGIATLGVVTATVSSWIIERAAGGKDDTEAATRGQVRSLSQQVSELTARLSEAPDPPGPSG